MPTPRSAHRVLRTLLGFFSLLAAAGGLVLIFGGKPLMVRLFLRPPESEVSTLLLLMAKEMGGILLMFGLLMFGLLFLFASRDPIRNVAIIDAVIAGLVRTGPYSLTVSLHAGCTKPVS